MCGGGGGGGWRRRWQRREGHEGSCHEAEIESGRRWLVAGEETGCESRRRGRVNAHNALEQRARAGEERRVRPRDDGRRRVGVRLHVAAPVGCADAPVAVVGGEGGDLAEGGEGGVTRQVGARGNAEVDGVAAQLAHASCVAAASGLHGGVNGAGQHRRLERR